MCGRVDIELNLRIIYFMYVWPALSYPMTQLQSQCFVPAAVAMAASHIGLHARFNALCDGTYFTPWMEASEGLGEKGEIRQSRMHSHRNGRILVPQNKNCDSWCEFWCDHGVIGLHCESTLNPDGSKPWVHRAIRATWLEGARWLVT